MPYAPGTTYRAGDYFASLGPQIAQNVQTWQRNREERQQTTATAEMLGRYLGEDPDAMKMFGDKLAQIPSMSAGQAKGVLGGVTTYLTQRHLKAAEDAQNQTLDIAKQEQALRAGDAAARLDSQKRLSRFNELVGQQINPPLMFSSAAGPTSERPPITGDTLTRLAAQAGVLGEGGTTSLLNAINTYQTRAQGLPLGTVHNLPGGTQIIGMGPGVAPHIQSAKTEGLPLGQVVTTPTGERIIGMGAGVTPSVQAAKETKGLDFGQTQETPEGTIIGMGLNSEPKFVSSADKNKPSTLDQGFVMYTPVYAHQLDAAEDAVKKFSKGKALGFWSSPEAVATMQQLPSLLANSFAKITDPSGTVRDSDREEFIKRLFPQGNLTRADVTLAALDKLKEDMAIRAYTWGANQKEVGKIPGGMPDSMVSRIKAIQTSAKSAPPTPSPGQAAAIPRRGILTPDGKLMEIRADQYEEALKHGYKPAPGNVGSP